MAIFVTVSPFIRVAQRTITILGFALVAGGLVFTDIFQTFPATPALHNGIIITALLGVAVLIKFLARKRLVDAIAIVILLLALRYIGATPILASLLILTAAMVIGHLFTRDLSKLGLATSAICGIAVLTGVSGWLLPFQIHTFLIYLFVLGGTAIAGRKIVFYSIRSLVHQWRIGTNAAPKWAIFAMTAVALCTVALLPPTVQFDDLATHILLPDQLVAIAHYKMDVASQIWATAPWASDVLQGYVAVLSGHNSRGAANALWLFLGLLMLWNLGAEVGLNARLRWLAISLYVTLPIVNALYGSMQADTAITTAALALVTLTARIIRTHSSRSLTPFMVVCGLLMALKTTQALLIAPMALIALWHIGSSQFLRGAFLRLPISLGICGSSYAYAWYLTGNPIFPIFNGIFRSPLAPATNFDDARWHLGLHWDSLWQITFHTSGYQEAYAGAFGFTLLALAGCVLLGVRHARLRWLIIGLLVSLVSSFAAIQYVRYIVPITVALVPLALLEWQYTGMRKTGELMLAGVAGLNAIFIPTAIYTLTSDIHWTLLSNINRQPTEITEQIERQYAVELLVARHLDLAWPQGFSLYLSNPARPFVAPFHGHAFARSSYDPSFLEAAEKADMDSTGSAWIGLFERTGMTHVLTDGKPDGALGASLRLADAQAELSIGTTTLWRLCGGNCMTHSYPLLDARDMSKKIF